jgi:hypothetical protein
MLPRKDISLLEISHRQFLALSDVKAVEVLRGASIDKLERKRHAFWGLLCGTVSYLASLGACIYLGMQGHTRLAALALSTSVLTIIKRMLDSRV